MFQYQNHFLNCYLYCQADYYQAGVAVVVVAVVDSVAVGVLEELQRLALVYQVPG